MDKFTAQEIIFGAIAEVNATRAHERPGTPLIPLLETTVLSGENPAVDSLDRLPDDGTPRRYWGRLDSRLAQVLRDQYGLHVHQHWPAVEHLNPNKLVRGGINCVVCGEPIAWKTVMRQPPPWPCEHDGSPFPEWQSRLPELFPNRNDSGNAPESTPIVNCSNCGEAMPCSCG